MITSIFQHEIKDGLADRIRVGAVAYEIAPKVVEGPRIQESLAKIPDKAKAADLSQLFYLDDILASVGWNNNDDVFDKREFWDARHTPQDKPLNLNHINREIIGHTIGSYVVNHDLQIIDDNTPFDLLPDILHILSNDVIYTAWEDTDYQKQIATILDEIRAGDWMVSMECLFRGFDYAVKSPDGENRVIARDKDSSFLTKHLRAYGGTGVYEGYKIGRLFRNMSFSGKGLVRRGANPNSIILNSSATFNYSHANLGYLSNISCKSIATEKHMDIETLKLQIAELNKAVADLTSERNSLKSKVDAFDAKASEEKYNAVAIERDSVKASVKQLEGELAATKELVKDSTAKAEKLQKDLDEKSKALDTLKAESVLKGRVDILVKAGLDEKDAKAKAEKFAALSDEMFAEVANMTGYCPPEKDAKASKPQVKTVTVKAEDKEDEDVDDSVAEVVEDKAATASQTETEVEKSEAAELEAARAEVADFLNKGFKPSKETLKTKGDK